MTYRIPLAAAALAVLAAGTVSAPVLAEPAVIKMGSHAPANSAQNLAILKPWMRKIEKESGNTVEFKEFWGGQLIRSPAKQYEGMLNGIQDASPVLPSYTQALFPDFSILALPMMFRGAGSEEASIAGWKLYEKGMMGGLDKVFVAAIYTNDNGGMHFIKTFKTADDMKGLKIRTAGPEEADVIKAIGAVPVALSITQVAESLHRGVIDGTMNGWSALKSFKIMPIIKTHVDAPFGVRGFFLGITKTVVDKLPAQAQKALKDNSGLKLSKEMGGFFEKEGIEFRKEATADPNHNVINPSPKEMKELEAKLRPMHDAWIKEEAGREAKYKALKEILASIRGTSS